MRRTIYTILTVASLLLLPGCCTKPTIPTDAEWKQIGPVIDVHCHVFNGRDLAVADWLHKVFGVPEVFAGFIELMVDALSDTPPPRGRKSLEVNELKPLADEIRKAVPDRKHPSRDDVKALEEIYRRARESGVVRPKLESLVTKGHAETKELSAREVGDTIRWAFVLIQARTEVSQWLVDAFPHTTLFTPSIIDMNFWFGDPEDGCVSWSFDEQCKFMKSLIDSRKGRLLPFIAFDPERERRRRESGDHKSLKAVLEEAANEGFVGVKLYPPFGYRPADNVAIPNTQTCGVPVTPAQRKAYDEIFEDFFQACFELELPVQAHCENPGAGMKECGENAAPAHWKTLFCKHPEWRDLHLDLMHFGGVDDLVGDEGTFKKSWAFAIADLMKMCPHLYADLGAEDVPATEEKRKLLYARLTSMPEARDRILFGTDWHLIVRHDDHDEFANRHMAAWLENYHLDATKRFASGAAREYLGFVKGGKNGNRIRALFKRKGWEIPAVLATE